MNALELERDDYEYQLRALRERAEHAEAQLAEAGWHPVTEAPPSSGQYLVVREAEITDVVYHGPCGWYVPVEYWCQIPPLPNKTHGDVWLSPYGPDDEEAMG